MSNTRIAILSAGAVLLLIACGTLGAGVTELQNGVSPKGDYAGCKDTWVGNGPWGETRRNNDDAFTLSAARGTGDKPRIRNVLMQFDLSPVPKGETIHRAVLRLAEAGYPRRDKDGAFKSELKAYVLTREWSDDANWSEHTRTNPREKDEGDWATEGGEYDQQTDFGLAEAGVVGTDTIVDGAFGHMHELDVTEAVRRWHAGKLPNRGLLLTGGDFTVASSDWPVPPWRPKLIVDHGREASGIAAVKPAPPGEIETDPVSQTPDPGKAKGDYGVVRVGQNADCALRGASADTYVKENEKIYPGAWGFTTHCRVGGAAGDVSRTLMVFDVSGIPANASVKSAKLVCSLVGRCPQVRAYRYGAFLVKLPEAPGWSAEEATAAERAPGKPWPGGGVMACSSAAPLSLGKVAQKELEQQGRKQTVDAGIEFDLTGAVRAWVGGKVANCGVVLDNRIEGGEYDIYGSRAWDPQLRPYLEIELSPAVDRKPTPVKIDKSAPAGDHWVQAMREVHKRFKGTPGTLAQYGDSITIANPFLGEYGSSKKIQPKNCPPDVKAECEVVEKYADLGLWVKWKGIGNTGCTTSDWLRGGVDSWQKQLNPEAAVIMFGTNDGMSAPQYAENIACSLRRMMADGTVPMLTSPPPKRGSDKEPYRLACVAIARGLKVPLIDFYAEILRRRPDDWDGQLPQFKEYKGYQQPTLMHDAHPSNAGPWRNDFGEEGLNKNGYNLRNYMTIRTYAQVISKVCQPKGE